MGKIDLYLIGVNHSDPLQRRELLCLIRTLAEENPGAPAFIAVEYDKDIFEWIVRQRPKFRLLLKEKWPDLTVDELDDLDKSLAYDGDSHLDIFPEAQTVWLDSGRPFPPHWDRDSPCVVSERFNHFQDCLKHKSLHENLPFLSECVRNEANYTRMDSDRSRKFAEMILAALAAHSPGWAFSITGAAHAKEGTSGSMANILSDKGVNFEVRIIC